MTRDAQSGKSGRAGSRALRLLLTSAALAVGAAPAAGLETSGDAVAITPPAAAAPDDAAGDPAAGREAALATNARTGDALLAWEGRTASGKREIMVRLLDATGAARGAAIAVSRTGAADDPGAEAVEPDVLHNAVADEYLVVWRADPGVAPLGTDEFEIWARRLDATGAPIGDVVRVSTMGTDGDADYGALTPAVAWSQTAGRYLVVWWGDDDSAGLANGEFEIWGQLLAEDLAPVGAAMRLSDMGPDGDPNFDATRPDVVWNPARDEYLVVWQGDDDAPGLINNGEEIFAQRVGPLGAEIGSDLRVSDMGPDASSAFDATAPVVAANPGRDEYLIAWSGDDNGPGLGDGQLEIFGQRLSGAGAEVGADVRLSRAGPDGDESYGATRPALTWQGAIGSYLLVWSGGDDDPALAPGEVEIIGRTLDADPAGPGGPEVRISSHSAPDGEEFPAESPALAAGRESGRFLVAWHGGVGPGPDDSGVFAREVRAASDRPATPAEPLPAACAPPVEIGGSGGGGKLRLTAAQLAINQRIGQAAVRRANAIQAWLDAGVVSGDICAGSLGAAEFDAGVDLGPSDDAIGPRPAPRPLAIAGARDRPRGAVGLTARQLLINQRIYQAAVRRANALTSRLVNLTGGDLRDGTLAADRLATNVRVVGRRATSAVAASRTATGSRAGAPGVVRLDIRQLEINQKIAQAAVRRTNDLRTTISSGLTGANFRDGTIGAADLRPPGGG